MGGGGFEWVHVTSAGPVAATANTGYVADSNEQVRVNLPESSSLSIGDTVRVSGVGSGGWSVAGLPGQSLLVADIGPGPWIPVGANRNWTSVASSADGSHLVAAELNGLLYTSIDSGVSWTPRAESRSWRSVASSADGSRLVAVAYPSQLYTSIDSGVTWTRRELNRYWASVASSADGSHVVAAVQDGQLYRSPSPSILAGRVPSAVELQYVGNNRFQILSQMGTLTHN
jgi:hypothetical protein